YNVLSVSGGEPLLYPALAELLEEGRAGGMLTMVASNGMLLDERRLAVLKGRADLLAISVDGVPASHDRIRGDARAFARMEARLAGVRESGIPFAFLCTLAQGNAHELEWIAEFAHRQGAALLQVHPLEAVGRAHRLLADEEPDDTEMAVAWLEVQRLQAAYAGRLRIHTDLVDFEQVRAHPACLLAEGCRDAGVVPLGELVSPLVVEADGTVSPLQYGFARAHALGCLTREPLEEMAARWKAERYPAFAAFCRRTYERMGTAALPIANWYRLVAQDAERDAPATATV
ncbi:MAG: radical SAM protein, partial [Gemmatimonadetes bacterium]|nr:radical SAM protein [Gemmatimonadota bacterium]